MNENEPVDPLDDEEEAGKGLLAGGAAALGGAAAMAKGAVDKAKDAAAGAAGGVTDAASGITGAASDAASGVTGAASDAASGAVSGVTGAASDAASGAVSGVTGAASDAASGVTGAATGAAGGVVASGAAASAAVTGAAGSAVSGAGKAATGAVDGVVASGSAASASVSGSVPQDAGAVPQDGGAVVAAGGAASAAVVGGGAGAGMGGTGGSGGSGGGGDDDDDKLVAAAPVSGENQIIILGLLVFLFLFFGGAIWSFFGGGDSEVVLGDIEDAAILAETNPECAAVLDALADSDLDETSYQDVTCSSEDGEAFLSGEVDSTAVQGAVVAAAGATLLDGDEFLVDTEDVVVASDDEEEVVEEEEEVVEEEPETETAAVETTTTTEAPATTTEAPETTTTEAPVAEPVTMWDALNSSGEAVQFAVIGGALGLQDDLELMENEDGTPVNRTLFAPSDAALTALGPEAIAGLSADPNAAAALVGYHFLEEPLLAEDLLALDGETRTTRAQLPLNITVVDGQVVLNGTSTVVSTDFVADNGVVHIIDVVLDPPTLNEVLDLENIEFDQSQATITAAGQTTLGRAVEFFTANPGVNASIEGHTDTDGSDELNAELSQARADAVRQFLIDAGLDGARFTATGFGETQPILVDGVEDKAASRRIEFVVQ